MVSFPEVGGCKFFESEGGYHPLKPKKFRLRHSLLLTEPLLIKYQPVNDIVSLPQAKIFINGVIKGQNQAIGMILHITI